MARAPWTINPKVSFAQSTFQRHKLFFMEDKLLSGKRILVVEDEMLVVMGIEDMLADLGCTAVSVAGNLAEALDLVATETFDLVTLDIQLGSQKSYPIANALNDSGVPFAFATAYGKHAVDEGFGHHLVLTKPYTAHQFVEVLSALLAEPRPPALYGDA